MRLFLRGSDEFASRTRSRFVLGLFLLALSGSLLVVPRPARAQRDSAFQLRWKKENPKSHTQSQTQDHPSAFRLRWKKPVHPVGNDAAANVERGIESRDSSRDEPRCSDSHDHAPKLDLQAKQRRLESALAARPDEVGLLMELGEVFIDRCLASSSTACFERAVELQPHNEDALAGLARAYLKNRKFDRARETLVRGLARNPEQIDLLSMKAKLLTHSRDYRGAQRVLEHALDLAPQHAALHSTLATIQFRMRDMDRSRAELLETIRLEPENTFAHHRLGTGSGELDLGLGPVEIARVHEIVAQASRLLELQEYEGAKDLLLEGIERYRGHHKLHHLLALCLTEIDFSQHALTSLPEFDTLFELLPSPRTRNVERVFVNYTDLDAAEKKIIDNAVAPFRHYLPRLIAMGATHYVLGLSESITDLPHFEHLEKRTTFDHRHYAHVRGLGGIHAATGREYLWEARDSRYNTLAHEFAHQVHLHALSDADREELEQLYVKALREDRALDYYARSDVAEYFAQGYEAFVSFFKRPCLSSTAGHTRTELEQRDPQLFAFIQRLSSKSWTRGPWLPKLYTQVSKIHEALGSPEEARQAYRLAQKLTGAPRNRPAPRHRTTSVLARPGGAD